MQDHVFTMATKYLQSRYHQLKIYGPSKITLDLTLGLNFSIKHRRKLMPVDFRVRNQASITVFQ